MKKFQKTSLVEIVEEATDFLRIQNVSDPSDQWKIPVQLFNETYKEFIPEDKEIKDFGWAIKQLKAGKKVARQGWNGKGMWIALMPALYLDKDIINGRTKKHIGEGKNLDSQPYLVMWTATEQWQPGWLASQADVLAEDWEEVI